MGFWDKNKEDEVLDMILENGGELPLNTILGIYVGSYKGNYNTLVHHLFVDNSGKFLLYSYLNFHTAMNINTPEAEFTVVHKIRAMPGEEYDDILARAEYVIKDVVKESFISELTDGINEVFR